MFTKDQQYSLIVQGGGQKGAFAAGVLDKFIDAKFDPFSLYIGTSAGALNVSSFVTQQKGLGLDFILNYTTRGRFFDVNKLLQKQQPMDLDWAFEFVNTGEFPLDIPKGKIQLGDNKVALACITDVEDLQDYYYPIFADNWFDVLRATCAIPMLYYHDIEFDGKKWVDGGVSATIPVQESCRRGINNMVVISTIPEGNRKELTPSPAMESLERWKKELEAGLDTHLNHLKVSGTKEKLTEFHKQFSEKLHSIKMDYKQFTANQAELYKIPQSEKSKLSTWINDNEKLSRLIDIQNKRVPFSRNGTSHLDMLVAHYNNHSQVEQFLLSPPEEVKLWHIQPKHELTSKGLMSHKDQILEDYQHGSAVAGEFLRQHLG
ncbi:patatin family protein [Vibrio sp. 10N.286.49.C2]|uniref:patatin-like phospholipase family protein n=1 Tax=unclassified Vibrio TaxID=2614977 RepID=UPI000C8640D8|nr:MULTISPECIES: patatin-like phospholipase family protein [unclassified Vibrio]PMH33732.1 patatin family protein [Vibrio sp. 10N.286.49.C2]PMH43989.1 patatin family protein [Vibrio sp. 10N.286.49.B1]PMH78753.1 patatin family protein [Vibrio sp. 10N.286.48.B7]